MYKNIIFDLGNVLLDFNPKVYLKNKLNDDKKVDFALGSVFKSDEWQMLDRGVITEEEAKENIVRRNIEYEEVINISFNQWYDMLTPLEEIVELLIKLKESGYKLYYLSNFHSKAFDIVTNRYEFFNLFNGGVVSFKEKLLKPEKEIYLKILEKYDLKANESIFIDDMKLNVEGARSVNIRGILFTDIEDLIKELKSCEILA